MLINRDHSFISGNSRQDNGPAIPPIDHHSSRQDIQPTIPMNPNSLEEDSEGESS